MPYQLQCRRAAGGDDHRNPTSSMGACCSIFGVQPSVRVRQFNASPGSFYCRERLCPGGFSLSSRHNPIHSAHFRLRPLRSGSPPRETQPESIQQTNSPSAKRKHRNPAYTPMASGNSLTGRSDVLPLAKTYEEGLHATCLVGVEAPEYEPNAILRNCAMPD